MLVTGIITVANISAADAATNNANEKVIFENCAPSINCIRRINNTSVDNANDFDVVMPMYNLTEHSNNYSITSGILWQYCRDELVVDANTANTIFNVANAVTDYGLRKITGKTGNSWRKKCYNNSAI